MSQYDVVVFGATSFVGQILCRYLKERHGEDGALSWCVAGRSTSKMTRLRSELGMPQLRTLEVDAADAAGLRKMCEQARVVVSTVGPYALYGSPLVEACAETGTDYCDLTGEVQWIHRMIEAHEDKARESGARIVHCCGFDSIPSDLGVWTLQQAAKARFDAYCQRVRLRVRSIKGGASGGTVASMMNIMEEVRKDPGLRAKLVNPYLLCPPQDAPTARQPNVTFAEYDETVRSWLVPFIMAAINTRVVMRSNALQDYAWGREFLYDEAVTTGDGLGGRMRAYSVASAMGGFLGMSAFGPTRAIVRRFVPQPGEGPSPEEQENGRFDLRLVGTTADGQTIRGKVTGDRDPGYGSTAKMLGEAAACLAGDVPDAKGGFWTPSTLFGQKLVDRLQAHAGLSFEIEGEEAAEPAEAKPDAAETVD